MYCGGVWKTYKNFEMHFVFPLLILVFIVNDQKLNLDFSKKIYLIIDKYLTLNALKIHWENSILRTKSDSINNG